VCELPHCAEQSDRVRMRTVHVAGFDDVVENARLCDACDAAGTSSDAFSVPHHRRADGRRVRPLNDARGRGARTAGVSGSKLEGMERRGTAATADQALVIAETLTQIMAGTLFGEPPGDLRSKQDKPDTAEGWATVERLAAEGVPYSTFLHQRHYGGPFRQVLDATSSRRGDLIEDAVEDLFRQNGVPYVRTGSHNQAEIMERFEVRVTPAPDFVVFDDSETLRAMLECKGANDGGTARDKALRFERLRDESIRLGGIPLLAVLGGIGWARVNDTLGPVLRDTDGRVFTLATLLEMLTVAPFPSLVDLRET
jgi:hypothetical protein